MEFLHCVIYLAILSFSVFLLGRIIPKKWFSVNLFPYKPYPFENGGRYYDKWKVKKWQNKVPDMSKIFTKLMPPKSLKNNRIDIMLRETCVAEFAHMLLGVLGFICVGLWRGIGGWIVSGLYLIGNIPFIMIQRYNRSRLMAITERKEKLLNGKIMSGYAAEEFGLERE